MKIKVVCKGNVLNDCDITDNVVKFRVDKRNYIDLLEYKESKASLKMAYQAILDKAIELEFSRVVIPLLGISNKIKSSASYEILREVLEKYLNIESNIKVLVNLYSYNRPQLLRCASICYDDFDYSSNDSIFMPMGLEYSITLNKIFNTMTTKEMFFTEESIDSPMDFIDKYMYEYDIKKSYLYSNGFDKDDCSKCRRGLKVFKKSDCYRASIVLGLNRTMTLQLMSYGGYSFNPNDQLDIWFNEYLEANRLAKNMNEFIDLYYYNNRVLEKIFN